VDERNVNETIVPKLTNDRQKNVMLLQQRGPDDMFDGALDEAAPCSYNVSVKSDFVVGVGEKYLKCEDNSTAEGGVRRWGPRCRGRWQNNYGIGLLR
jgi:hypothetical protein